MNSWRLFRSSTQKCKGKTRNIYQSTKQIWVTGLLVGLKSVHTERGIRELETGTEVVTLRLVGEELMGRTLGRLEVLFERDQSRGSTRKIGTNGEGYFLLRKDGLATR